MLQIVRQSVTIGGEQLSSGRNAQTERVNKCVLTSAERRSSSSSTAGNELSSPNTLVTGSRSVVQTSATLLLLLLLQFDAGRVDSDYDKQVCNVYS